MIIVLAWLNLILLEMRETVVGECWSARVNWINNVCEAVSLF